MSLLNEAKRIRAALSLEGLTNQVTEYAIKYDSFVTQKEAAKAEDLDKAWAGNPAGMTTTLREYLDGNIVDAQNVLAAAKTNLEGLKAAIQGDPAFVAPDLLEIDGKIATATTTIATLKPTDAIGVS